MMMPDREKVIAWLTEISLRPCDFTTDDFDAYETELLANEALEICEDAKVFNQQRNDALALLKEQQERLDSIVCFENGDQVRTWHCPFCKSEVRFVLKDWNVIEDHLLGIKKVVERPQDIRVVTDDGRVIVLKKEIPTMVMNRKDWSDNDA